MKLRSAQGNLMMFWCLGCDEAHYFAVAPDPRAWQWNGSLEAPTVTPSILCTGFSRHSVERTCHTYIKDGRIQYLTDCSHALAGQTVELPEWPHSTP